MKLMQEGLYYEYFCLFPRNQWQVDKFEFLKKNIISYVKPTTGKHYFTIQWIFGVKSESRIKMGESQIGTEVS